MQSELRSIIFDILNIERKKKSNTSLPEVPRKSITSPSRGDYNPSETIHSCQRSTSCDIDNEMPAKMRRRDKINKRLQC